MLTVGLILKKAREQSHKTIEDIATATRIKPQYLLKIENNEFEGFVSSTAIRGFIRSYANVLNLEAEKLVAIYRRQIGETEKIISRNTNKISTEGLSITPQSIIITGVFGFLALVVVLLIYQFYQVQQPPILDIVNPNVSPLTVETEAYDIKGSTENSVIVTLNGNQITLTQDETFSVPVTLKAGENIFTLQAWKIGLEDRKNTKQIVIIYDAAKAEQTKQDNTPKSANFTVETTEEAWVQIIADDVQQGVGVVAKNYKRDFQAKESISVVTGRPTVTKFTLAGKEYAWTIRNGVGSLTCTQTLVEWECK